MNDSLDSTRLTLRSAWARAVVQRDRGRGKLANRPPAPNIRIAEVIDALRVHYDVTVEEAETARETVTFRLLRALA